MCPGLKGYKSDVRCIAREHKTDRQYLLFHVKRLVATAALLAATAFRDAGGRACSEPRQQLHKMRLRVSS